MKVHRVTFSSTVCAIVFTERLTVCLKSLKIFQTERFVNPTSNLNSLKAGAIIAKRRLARFFPLAEARGIRARYLMSFILILSVTLNVASLMMMLKAVKLVEKAKDILFLLYDWLEKLKSEEQEENEK